MVRGSLKSKVKKMQSFTTEDVLKMIESILKEQNGERDFSVFTKDSNKYFKENFASILCLIPDKDLRDVMLLVSRDEEKENIFNSLINDNIEALATKINNYSKDEVYALSDCMSYRGRHLDKMLEGKLLDFYQLLNSNDKQRI